VLLILPTLGWVICAVYSTIPGYWMLIHPRADYWRAHRSPYRVLLPFWAGMFVIVLLATAPFRSVFLYRSNWVWLPAGCLFAVGICLYKAGGARFSLQQLQGMPELSAAHSEQPLVMTGVRGRVRHPIYLAHFCEMLAWSVGTGLVVCFAVTALTVVTGAIMIRAEDGELVRRFGSEFRSYRASVPSIFPSLRTRGTPGSVGVLLVIVWGLSVGLTFAAVAISWAYSKRDQPMLFQHGTPEVPGGRAIAIMNPFRDRLSENTADQLIHDLHSGDCERVIAALASGPDDRICGVLRQDSEADLIWRDDKANIQVLVYDLPQSRSRLWIVLMRDEVGFEVRSVSLIR